MTAEKLFDRRIELRVDDFKLDEFDIEFKVEKKLRAEPNDAQIKIYNLPPDLRSRFQKSAVEIELSAGYPRTITRLFKGSVRFVNPQPMGADFVTTIEAGEAESAYRTARINKVFSGGTSLAQVVKDLVATFPSIGAGNLNDVGFDTVHVQSALTLSGPSAHLLDQQLKSYGFGYSINQDHFVFVKLGRPTSQQAIVLDDSSGLLEAPEMAEKKAETSDKSGIPTDVKPRRYMKFRCLMDGRIEPGRALQIVTPELSGLFVTESVTHAGSSFDNDFYSDGEAFAQT